MFTTIIIILLAAWAVDRFVFRRSAKVIEFENTNHKFGELDKYNRFKLRRNGTVKWYVCSDKALAEMRKDAIEIFEMR